jgi:hypothetical protein
MGPLDRTAIRMEHWLEHNRQHCEEYEQLAQELEALGKSESARALREMIAHVQKGNDQLGRALAALGAETQ